ncbi:MAG: NAD+ synthase [Acidobacteriota bacterium]
MARHLTVSSSHTKARSPADLLRVDPSLARRIISRFLRDSIRRHGFKGAIIGLSGGLDSSVTALLAAEGLGAGSVRAVALPFRESDPASLHLAASVAEAASIPLETVSITGMAAPYLASLPKSARRRRGNVLARLRMIVLYDLSARDQMLVVGTSNKTEILLGYTTLHGDAACALLPIGDLYKTQVRALALHIGVPAPILERPPSADLWKGQTDESELGFSYAAVDRLLVRMIDHRLPPDRLLEEGFDPALIRRVRAMIRRSQFKRRFPPVAKLSHRTVGMDFRYSRDWDRWGSD